MAPFHSILVYRCGVLTLIQYHTYLIIRDLHTLLFPNVFLVIIFMFHHFLTEEIPIRAHSSFLYSVLRTTHTREYSAYHRQRLTAWLNDPRCGICRSTFPLPSYWFQETSYLRSGRTVELACRYLSPIPPIPPRPSRLLALTFLNPVSPVLVSDASIKMTAPEPHPQYHP
jgi:hypothetical protein